MITPELIAQIRAALDMATPGKWVMSHRGDLKIADGRILLTSYSDGSFYDLQLIVLLHNHASALLDELERLREDNGQLKDDKDQMEIGNIALMQRVAELEVANAVLKEKLRTAEDFNENYTVVDDIGPLPKCFRCRHVQSMASRGADAPCYHCSIADGYPKFEEMEK